MTVYAGTGHRPHKLKGFEPQAREWYRGFAIEVLAGLEPRGVITGMALGWDMALAEACIELDVPFVAAIPFEGQEYLWPEETQEHYHSLLSEAKKVKIVSHGPYRAKMMHDRNAWMIDRCEHLIALWDGDNKTGTAQCVRYARKVGRPVINVWGPWLHFVEEHVPKPRKREDGQGRQGDRRSVQRRAFRSHHRRPRDQG